MLQNNMKTMTIKIISIDISVTKQKNVRLIEVYVLN